MVGILRHTENCSSVAAWHSTRERTPPKKLARRRVRRALQLRHSACRIRRKSDAKTRGRVRDRPARSPARFAIAALGLLISAENPTRRHADASELARRRVRRALQLRHSACRIRRKSDAKTRGRVRGRSAPCPAGFAIAERGLPISAEIRREDARTRPRSLGAASGALCNCSTRLADFGGNRTRGRGNPDAEIRTRSAPLALLVVNRAKRELQI